MNAPGLLRPLMGNAAKRGACLDGGAGRGPSEDIVNGDIPGYSAVDAAAIVAAAAAADAAAQSSKPLVGKAKVTRRQSAQNQQLQSHQLGLQQELPQQRHPLHSSPLAASQQARPAQPGQSLPQALESTLNEAMRSKSSSAISRAVDLVNESVSKLTPKAANEAKHHLRIFAENEFCSALQSGDCMHIVHCARLVVFLGGDEPGTGAGNVASPPTTMLQNRRIRRGTRVRAARAQAAVAGRRPSNSPGVMEYWEEEVHAAWGRRDAADLAWALQLAEEAGVSESKLQAPRAALAQLAQVTLAEAARRGDSYTLIQALRIAEELGLAHEVLAEARLTAAEFWRDPHLFAQELGHAREAGLPPARLDAASKVLQALHQAEEDAAAQGLTTSMSARSMASNTSATSSDQGTAAASALPEAAADASEVAAAELECVDGKFRKHPQARVVSGVDPIVPSLRPESVASSSTRPESSAGTARTMPESVSSSSTRPESTVEAARTVPDALSAHLSRGASCSFHSDITSPDGLVLRMPTAHRLHTHLGSQ